MNAATASVGARMPAAVTLAAFHPAVMSTHAVVVGLVFNPVRHDRFSPEQKDYCNDGNSDDCADTKPDRRIHVVSCPQETPMSLKDSVERK
jgi:hypothetical protein